MNRYRSLCALGLVFGAISTLELALAQPSPVPPPPSNGWPSASSSSVSSSSGSSGPSGAVAPAPVAPVPPTASVSASSSGWPTPSGAPPPPLPPQQWGAPPPITPPVGAYPDGSPYGPPPLAPPPIQPPGIVRAVPAPPPVPDRCCRFTARFNPFDLLSRKLSFQAELAIWGPFSVEFQPSWIFNSTNDQVSASGYSLAGEIGFYFTSKAPKGVFLKAHVGYEHFSATVTNPGDSSLYAQGTIASPIIGGMLGSSTVFGKNWGLDISGGIGIGVATAGSQTIIAPGKGKIPPFAVTYFEKSGIIQLLGSLSVGIGF